MKLIVLKNNVPLNDVSVDTTDPHEMYEIYVGRSEDCHVQIDDPLISRHHFVLKSENGNWFCEKLSQLGVITINGSIVTKNHIQNGDEIKSGSYSVIVMDLTPLRQASPVIEPAPTPVVHEFTQTKSPLIDEEPSLVHEPEPMEETVVIPEKKSEPQEDLSSFDDDLSGEENESSLDFGESSDSGESTESPEENTDLDFGGGELSESTDFNSGDESGEGSYEVATTDDSNESTRFFKAFVNYQLVLFGEHAPYDRFQIDVDEVYIGREPKKCQIILNDPEVSSVHAVLKKNNAEIILEDLNSSNGTILNGERINKAVITAGDEFVIGGTSFTLEVRSDLLESESERLMPVESGQVVETEEIVEEEITGDGDISFEGDAVPEKSLLARFKKDPAFRKKAIYAIAGLMIVLFLIPTEEEEAPKKAEVVKETKAPETGKPKLNLSKELENARNVAYELGVSYFEQSRYDLAQVEFQKVVGIDPNYKNVQSYLEQTNVGLKRLQELEAERRAEEDRIRTKKLIDELMVKARDAVKERQVPLAESLFAQIVEKDPENIEVSQLKLELESWQKEEERKALERAAKEAARKKMVDALSPGKTFYLKKEWYRSINKLEDFLRIKEMDEDLIKEASEMLSDAKNQLASDLGPLLGRARSLKEGQDLKSAYQAYLEVLRIEPSNKEALDEVDEIKSQLDARSRKVYREAIIAESLSLFNDAKEKFQEVQQISPTDSEYYKKASEKLKSYLE